MTTEDARGEDPFRDPPNETRRGSQEPDPIISIGKDTTFNIGDEALVILGSQAQTH